MFNKAHTIFILLILLWLGSDLGQLAYAQDFSKSQRLLTELLPTFNAAFEENNLELLKSSEYKKKLRKLQSEYAKYNAENFEAADSVQRMNNEAILLALSSNYHKALRIFEGINLDNHDTQLIHNRGIYNLLAGKYEAARNDFAINPSDKTVIINTLYSFGKEKDFDGGQAYFNHISSNSIGAKWNYNGGLLHKLSGNTSLAIEELNNAVRQGNDVAAYRLLRGDMLMKNGDKKKAVKDFEKASKKFPKAQIRYANALLSLHRFSEAKSIYLQYLKDKNRQFKAQAYLGLAHCYYGLSEFDEAIRYYRLTSTMMRESPSLLSGIANIHLIKHEYQFASGLFDRAIIKDPTYQMAFLGRAVANFGLKNYALALSDFEKAGKELDPQNPFYADIFVSKAYCEYFLGNKKEARMDFETAIRLDPKRYEALAGVSNILIDGKKFSEAGQYLVKALKYDSGYSEMWSNYGNLLLHFEMFNKSYQVFRKSVLLKPTNVNAQNGWGVVLLENDKLDIAMNLFDSLVHEHPKLSFLHNNFGIVNAYLGNRYEQKFDAISADMSYEKAFLNFQNAMETAPTRKLYNVNQGNVYRYWEKFDDAKLSYQTYQDKSALNNTGVMYAAREMLSDAKYYLGVAIKIDSLHKVFQYNLNILVQGKQKEMKKLVASAGDDGPFSDIGIKYSLDGFVTIYLYDYVYDQLTFPGRHFMPLPVEEYEENYFIPEIDFKFLPYSKKKTQKNKIKRVNYKTQKVKMPRSRNKSGTKCPVLF